MAKKNDDFFKEKKPWSEVKDELLGCYFKPYVSKILHTYKPLVYVDCFAGKGKFEDVDLCQYFGHKKLNIFSLHDINT
jgi:hypothetical protein